MTGKTEKEGKERKDLRKWTRYRIMIDYSKFPLFEDIEWECEDGVVRRGAFIPYEENNVYCSEKGRYQALEAKPVTSGFRASSPDRFNQTHALHPYWTREHRERMEAMGFNRRNIWLGNMSMIRREARR